MRLRRVLRFWGPDVEADVDDELRFHLESCAADLVARGHPPDEARRLARARFGDVDRVRDWLRTHDHDLQRRARRAESMETLLQDLRYAARKLWQQPAFTGAVTLVLALGIGAAAAMFSAVDAALLRPLPFLRDDRLVMVDDVDIPVREFARPAGVPKAAPDIADVRALRGVFAAVAAYAPGGLNLTGGDEPARVRVTLATRDFFATIGRAPARGRGFTVEEATPDGPRAAVLSDALWRRQFGGDPAVIGREVRLNDVPHRVVGVMPPGVAFPEQTEIYLPLTEPMSLARWEPFRQFMPTRVIARLAPGVTAHAAGERMLALVRAYRHAGGPGMPRLAADSLARPLREALVGRRRTALLVLFAATAMVLLVACANAANLLLSRAAARRAEMTLRATLGATRGRLVRQLLVESTLLALAGAALGVAFAFAGLGALGSLMPSALAGTAPPRVDLRVLGFSLGVALLTGLGFGLWPAIGASRADAAETVKAGAPGGTAPREGARLRQAFVVAELALALMLAVGAGLMLRSFDALLATDIGVRAEHAATLELSLPNARYRQPAASRRFLADVLARLAAMPDVQAAAFVNNLPLSPNRGIGINVTAVGRPQPAGEMVFASQNIVSPDYFRAAGIPLLRGRTLAAGLDSTRRAELVVSDRMEKVYWPGEDALGKLVAFGRDTLVVVGVVGDVRAGSVEDAPPPQMYLSIDRSPPQNVALVARGPASADVLARRLRDAVRAADPAQAVFNVRPMSDVVAAAVAPRRTNTLLITLFGVVALGLAAVGVYGVIAYAVARRTREIGIRMALGAQRDDVLRLMVAEAIPLAGVGVAIGLAGAWALRTVIASLLYGVTPADPATFVGAAALLLAIAAVATLVPAHRATLVDPARTIKAD
ncbi:permease [Gemmatirosa kalamazoonensis]|uniref:Permease n=1 Tax=Gemmatirosa kalamazoonensis TaxID=861299 RepID=W0RBU0_9BACT|nr:ABC transporter permease [Gemmatirosa kalamazoonensis]AHG87922.1 permease [Gemmatirosa kalamazoonensis]